MDGTTWVGAGVAIISAAIAGWFALSAKRAEARIAAQQHRIQRLDREAEELRDAFTAFLEASVSGEATVGFAAREVLRAQPRCSDALAIAAGRVLGTVHAAAKSPGAKEARLLPDYDGLSAAYRACQEVIRDERDRLLAG